MRENRTPIEIHHERVETNGITLHCATVGEGPVLVLLHGFPDFWLGWEELMRPLAESFRVVAPDLRGYGESDRPQNGYDLSTLAADIAGLIAELGGPARVVGHDWGGAIAWALATEYPDAVDRLTILNAPHPHHFTKKLFTTRQFFRSWYMFFFQIPWLPEICLRAQNGAALTQMWRNMRGTDAEAARPFVDQIIRPGVLEATLAYYRTAMRGGPWKARRYAQPVQCPVQIIWGEQDPALGVGLLEGLERYAPNLQIHRVADAGHWVHRDATDEVLALISAWMAPSG